MNIYEMIKGMCPNGIEYKKIGDLLIKGPKSKLGAKAISELPIGENISFTSGNKTYYTDEYLVDGEYIFMNDGGIADTKYNNGKTNYTDHVFAFTIQDCNVKYIYHVLLNLKDFINEKLFVGSGLKNLNKKAFMNLEIPVPPVSVQDKIVDVLDKMTSLTDELTDRKKQYSFYRNNILDFNNVDNIVWKELRDDIKRECPDGVKFDKLEKMCNFQNGFAFQANKMKNTGDIIIKIGNIKDNSINIDNCQFFDKNNYPKINFENYSIKPGNVVVAMSGATTGKIGRNNTKKTFYLNQRVGLFKPLEELSENFLYYFLLLKQETFLNLAEGSAAQPNLSTKSIMSLQIPVLPLSIQNKIVNFLDNFDSYTNNLQIGLPGEIEYRKQQYEFYRDKLLSFDYL